MKRIFWGFCFITCLVLAFSMGIYIQKKGIIGKEVVPVIRTNYRAISNYFASLKAKPELIRINFKKSEFRKIKKARDIAIKKGLNVDTDAYAKGVLAYKGDSVKIKAKLKGVIGDHWEDDHKWSLKIKLKKSSPNLPKRFSLILPVARNYIHEWIFLKLLALNDIKTPVINFNELNINGESFGIYILEEDYSVDMFNQTSSIVCFDKDYFVQSWKYNIDYDFEVGRGSFEARPISPTEPKVMLKDSILKENLQSAITKLEQLKNKDKKVEEVFDIEKLAKYLAIRAIMGSIEFDPNDNKFYYNPQTLMLEPIGMEVNRTRDGYVEQWWLNNNDRHKEFRNLFFSSDAFQLAFYATLSELCTLEWWNNSMNSISTELENNLAIIYQDNIFFNYDEREFEHNIQYIRHAFDIQEDLVNAYIDEVNDSSIKVEICNIHVLPIHQIHILVGKEKHSFPQQFIRAKTTGHYLTIPKHKYDIDTNIKIQYSIVGSKNKITTEVHPWKRNQVK